ncbi:MAG: cytochrome c [Sphingomonadaceae bacterium]|nr:cytochrome c [Sphingomonadaceae bacterium]
MKPIIALLTLILIPACADTAMTPVPMEVADVDPAVRGRGIVERNCAACHAIAATDSSPNPKAPPLRTLSKKYPMEGLREAFGRDILLGHEGMPEFDFDPSTSHDIVAYLKTVQAN